jgi:hypothetical protein
MKKIMTQTELEQLHKSGKGFIYNDYAGPSGTSASKYNLLHRTDCPWIKRTNLNVAKHYAETQEVAVAWLEQNRGREGVRWRWCKTCHYQSAQVTTATGKTAKAHKMPQPAGPFTESEVERLLVRWFRDQGYQVQTQVLVPSGVIDLVVTGREAEWIIEVKGEDRGGFTSALMNFQDGIGQLVSRMTDPTKKYSLAIPVTADYRKVVAKYRESIGAERLGVYFLTVDRTGKVKRFAGDQLKELYASIDQAVNLKKA